MANRSYIVLEEVFPPEQCYLSEVLNWCAFRRFPTVWYGEDEEYRLDINSFEGFDAPVPAAEEISEEECRYAGIPLDPKTKALVNDTGHLPLEHYDDLIRIFSESRNIKQLDIDNIKKDRAEAEKYHAEFAEWMPIYEDYIDQFQAEIALKLRRGELVAYGAKLPEVDREKVDGLLDNGEFEFTDLHFVPIPKEHWILSSIDWDESSITGRIEAYVWARVNTEEMLELFPIEDAGQSCTVNKIANNYFVTTESSGTSTFNKSRRGRPPLPWEAFHVEVAKKIRDGSMPQKKEAGIAEMQEWSLKHFKKTVGRSSIGQKLKPYYDELMK